MNIGDKVRLIHGKEQGRVVKLIDSKQVEVEIEDGFRIPVLKSELVVVAQEETRLVLLDEDLVDELHTEKWAGIYLAFTSFNDKVYELNLINDTGCTIYFSIGEEKGEEYKGVYSGVLEPESFSKLHELTVSTFDLWPVFVVQTMVFSYGKSIYRAPMVKKVQFRSSSFFKNKKIAPIINQTAVVYRLDADAIKVDAKFLEEKMTDVKNFEPLPLVRPSKEIDLHIEKLIEEHQGMSNSAILKLQLDNFQKNFENAMATGMDEIVFIHGVGNGVLKNEIHKRLSNRKDIKFFKDAQKEKFGYGATFIRLK